MTDRGTGTGRAPTDEVVHLGVPWRRSPSGRLMWFNEGLRRWVLWVPGSDAPPLPEGWELVDATGVAGADVPPAGGASDRPGADAGERPGLPSRPPGDAMSRRPPMKSPYRVAPIVIAALIVVAALYQATQSPAKATKQDIAAAFALKGRCLARSGGTTQYPDYSATPVSCSAHSAAMRVVEVVRPGKDASCPRLSIAIRAVDPNLAGEPVECLVPVATG